MQNGYSLNLNWYFKQGFDPKYISDCDTSDFERVHIPHTVQEIPYDCFDQTITCMVSTYVKEFTLEDISGKRVLLEFEGVSAYYELYVNGKFAGDHKGAYSTALFDVTEYVSEGENKIVMMVDSHERNDIPPNGSTVDYLIYGGIYRDVTLYIQEDIYIRQALIRYELEDRTVHFHPELLICAGHDYSNLRIVTELLEEDKVVFSDTQTGSVRAEDGSFQLQSRMIPELDLWNLQTPFLYTVRISMYSAQGHLLDTSVVKTGFRSVRVDADGFYLNDEKIKLIGLNRHQSYPYVGYAMGKRAQQKDADLLKRFMGLNMVRCSHYMQSKYFLQRCDEIGLLVFEEIPGWGYIGGDEFRKIVFQDLENMVTMHYNHPGIVLWGTRLNETTDEDELYTATNRRCKELDPSRPTTGVRWETGSNLIEDIYSYNDYSEDENGEFVLLTAHEATGKVEKLPYLISEHTGAVLPTKPFDSEERMEKFALRHAKVLGKVQTMDEYLGALGWCMFDYNTHNDHNSLSKVCYHGVLDMYRIPKWAAYVYASQKNPDEEIIMEPCSMVGRGERCEPVPFFVLTNCDYIDVTLSKDITRTYYPSVKYNGMAHPPIEVKQNGEFWQHRWEGAVINGYVDGKKVITKRYSNNPYLKEIKVIPDDEVLYNDRVDETRVTAYFLDENGNRLWYHQEAVRISVTGDAKLIGPELRSVLGGTITFWIKTEATFKPGGVGISVHSEQKDLTDGSAEIFLIV